MRSYIVEFSPVQPGPLKMRHFGMFEAKDDAAAIEAVQAVTLLRQDQRTQADVYRRDPLGGRETKIWSGLHKMRSGKPRLSVVA